LYDELIAGPEEKVACGVAYEVFIAVPEEKVAGLENVACVLYDCAGAA